MRNIILLAAVVLMGVMGGNTLSAQKFGYLNSQAILAELPEVKQSEAELEALQKQLQKKGQTMLETLQADYQVMQKKVDSGELSPKMQEEEGKKLQVREEELNKFLVSGSEILLKRTSFISWFDISFFPTFNFFI